MSGLLMNYSPRTGDGLSVVVIGRNSQQHLRNFGESLRGLRGTPLNVEVIYVDGASTDDSVEIAKRYADFIYVLEDSPNLCAAAGRYVGTLASSLKWILYLDGDMIMRDEFLEPLVNHCGGDEQFFGLVGLYRNVYTGGTYRQDILRLGSRGVWATHFGGAVLLPKKAVVEAGNWDPCVFSNEEIDLYTRLRARGVRIKNEKTPMVDHYTKKWPKWKVLVANLVPGGGLGKKFYGLGQLVAARFRRRSVTSLVRYFPYPFMFWGGLLGAAALLLSGLWLLALALALVTILYVAITKGPNFVVLYAAFAVQATAGFRRYDASYVPRIASTWTRRGELPGGASSRLFASDSATGDG